MNENIFSGKAEVYMQCRPRCARISGWCAHRMEEMINGKRIIRPAYKAINLNKNYIPLSQRI